MSLEKKKIEELLSTAQRITDAKNNKEELLFDITSGQKDTNDKWKALLEDDVLQDPNKSYNLFYGGIQSFLLNLMPKSDIRTVVLELKTIMLTGKEKKMISYGPRGADSRMSKTKEMESMIDTLTVWSDTPEDFFKLATLLLEKNIELGYVAEGRTFGEYLRVSRK